jgi:hypothetical protein
MASLQMWRYLDILNDRFLLPHYIVSWNGASRSLQRGKGKEIKYFAFYAMIAVVHIVLGEYYVLKIALSGEENPTGAPRDFLLLLGMLIIAFALYSTSFAHTLSFNKCKFIRTMNLLSEFQQVLEGNFMVL